MTDLSQLHKAIRENAKLTVKIKSLEKQLQQQGDENRILVRMCNEMSQELGRMKCTGTVGDVVL